MNKNLEIYTELLELLENKEEIIKKQNNLIAKLVNENLEQDNMINVLISETQMEQVVWWTIQKY